MKQERNAKCNCGSGLKYKKCCFLTERKAQELIIENFRKPHEEKIIPPTKLDGIINNRIKNGKSI